MTIFNSGFKVIIVLPAVVGVWTALAGGLVDDLDFTIPLTDIEIELQNPLEQFANIVATIVDVMPWFEIIYELMLAGIVIKLMLFFFSIFIKVVGILVS